MTTLEQTILNRFREKVKEHLPLHEMVLFGSRARGDADGSSDMDVLVALECPADRPAREYVGDCAWEAGFEHGIVVASVTVSREEWEEGPLSSSLLAIAISENGVRV